MENKNSIDFVKSSESIEKIIILLQSLLKDEEAILTEEVLKKEGINLEQFYPKFENGKYQSSDIAFEVAEGKLYDLKLGHYRIIPLTYGAERKNYHFTRRFLVLKDVSLIFELFLKIRKCNSELIRIDNGIWAYRNDSDLRCGVEAYSDRMAEKLEAERSLIVTQRNGKMIAFQAVCVAGNISHVAMEMLINELGDF